MLTVYTCIVGAKDQLLPIDQYGGVRHVCFTDQPFRSDVWEIRPLLDCGYSDKRRTARLHKINSHILFPNCDTIWVDGRVVVKGDPKRLLEKYKSNIAIRHHLVRDCIYDEAVVVERQNYEKSGIVRSQMQRYRSEGMPEHYGLHETGILLRRSCREVDEFNALWWSEVSCGSKRDQLSVDWVRFKYGFEIEEMDREEILIYKHLIKTDVET